VTVHDGFTLRDLVSYDRKHNDANGEDNRDGTTDNRSWNCGVEGPTDDPEILALRASQSRAMLATLLLSAGVPLLLGGDELGRTQRGNNNAYCQDNEIAWYDWANADPEMAAFVRRLIAFRAEHPVLRRREYAKNPAAITWYAPNGRRMSDADWADRSARSVALRLDGVIEPEVREDGSLLIDSDVALLVNAWWEPLTFSLPWAEGAWWLDLDTYDPQRPAVTVGGEVTVSPRSLVVLTRTR
jgi:glycogen operon protein